MSFHFVTTVEAVLTSELGEMKGINTPILFYSFAVSNCDPDPPADADELNTSPQRPSPRFRPCQPLPNPTSKRYWGNIGPISHAILAQYCIQYWHNIAEGYVLSILCQYWRQYWCNIGDHIAPILAPMIKLVPILVQYMPILAQYITNIAPMFLHAEILAQYCIQYWRNIAEGYWEGYWPQYWCISGDHIAPILAI